MSALSIQPTYPIFTDIDGQPLEAGYIWLGAANLDPQVNPINVYWDAALSIPATQPIRTLGGYPSRNGTPARLYVNSDYSIRVMNRNGSLVYSAPAATERYSDAVVSGVNAQNVVYDPPFAGGVQTNVEEKLGQYVSILDFGADPTGATNSHAAIQEALDHGGLVYAPAGTYTIDDSLLFPRGTFLYGDGMNRTAIITTDGSKPVILIDQTKVSGAAVTDTGVQHMRLSGGSAGIQMGTAGGTNWGVKCTVDRVWLYQNTTGAIIYNGWENYFFKCLFDFNTNANLYIAPFVAPAFQNTNWFEQCDFTNCAGSAQVNIAHETTHSTTINNCVFEGALDPATVGIKVTSALISELRILNCYFEDHDTYYIQVPDSNSNGANEISGCSFQDKAGRTDPMISTVNGFLLSSNFFKADFGSAALAGAKNSFLINNRRTSTGTNNLQILSPTLVSNTLVQNDPVASFIIPKYLLGSGTTGQTNGVASTSKTVGAGVTVDFAAMKLSDGDGSAVVDITATGTNATGTDLYFKGTRHVRMDAGASIIVTTLGTDSVLNCALSVTWSSSNTFKISIGNLTASTAGMAVTLDVSAGGGADAATGYIEYVTAL
jgi:hypothetical protein